MACEECTRNCELVHRKKQDLSGVSRFIKILVGDDVPEVLCLPPKFAKTTSHLIGKETKLEDTNGAQWTVTLSNHEGFLAFCKGWMKFAADHKLQIGEFLVFNYLKNGHFIVQVFDHTCSEKTDFGPKICSDNRHTVTTEKIVSETTLSGKNATNVVNKRKKGRPFKKARPCRNVVETWTISSEMDIGEENTLSDSSAKNRDPSSTSVPVESNIEIEIRSNHPSTSNSPLKMKSGNEEQPWMDDDLHVIMDQVACCAETEKKTVLNDLSVFEIKNSHEQPWMDDDLYVIMDRSAYCAESEKKTVLYDLSLFEMKKSEGFSGKRCSDEEEDARAHAQINVESMVEANLFEGNKIGTGYINNMSSTKVPDIVHKLDAHDKVKAVKKEQVTLREEARDRVQKSQDLKPSLIRETGSPATSILKRKATKLELDDLLDEPALNQDTISCLAMTDNRDFIELPARLPSLTVKLSESKMDYKCVILLQDPKKRQWPAIYYERFGFFVLNCGWERFNQANMVRPGDRYTFSLKNESRSVYKVDVDRV